MIHFWLKERNRDGGEAKLTYCQLKLPSNATNLLIKTRGDIPLSFMHALTENQRLKKEIEQLTEVISRDAINMLM